MEVELDPNKPDFWKMKIAALFHDPPAKPWVSRHAEFSASKLPRELGDLRVGGVSIKELVENHHMPSDAHARTLSFADWCSSAVERPLAEFVRGAIKATFIHPLSGLELGSRGASLLSQLTEEEASEISEELKRSIELALKKWVRGLGDAESIKAAYLLLWRTYEGYWWRAAENVLKTNAKLLIPPPADTRVPTHSVFDHVESTSALVPCCSEDELKASLVSLDIGGVQPFISASRKISDLWAGSWLASLLSWCALREVCELLSPDAIAFPYLKGVPLVDAWIAGKVSGGRQSEFEEVVEELCKLDGTTFDQWVDKLALSLIPPTASIIAPKHLVDEVEERIRNGLGSGWRKIVDISWAYLRRELGDAVEAARECWERQTEELPLWPVRIVHTEFPRKSDAQEIKKFLLDNARNIPKELRSVLESLVDLPGGARRYPPRPSIVYGAVFAINSAKLASLIQEFQRRPEPSPSGLAERCNMCGVRNPLFSDKSLWRRLGDLRVVEWDEARDSGEYLCSICLIKRLLPRVISEVMAEVVGVPREVAYREAWRLAGFPSTSDFATARFKWLIIEAARRGLVSSKLDELASKLISKVDSMVELGVGGEKETKQPPAISSALAELRKRLGNRPFLVLLELSGEWLDPDTYDRCLQRAAQRSEEQMRKLREEVEEAKRLLRELREEVGKYCEALPDEPQPPLWHEPLATGPGDTFAILYSDGDYMGEWLLGSRTPTLLETIHPDARKDVEEELGSLVRLTRPLSPASHVSISRALLHFAKEVVPRVVAERGLGAVVYAGGDDVLALLPPERALTIAQLLYEEFSREWDNRAGHVVLGMGHRASCSAGLVMAHYMRHLARVVERARELAEEGKGEEGKGAVKAELYGRAGLICRTSRGLHWIEPWHPSDARKRAQYVDALSERGTYWVGVSWVISKRDPVNVLLSGAAQGRPFVSPVVVADQIGALARGCVGRLRAVSVSRRALYELQEYVEEVADQLEPGALAALAQRVFSRHVKQPKGLPSLSKFVSEVVGELGARRLIEASMVAEHAYEFAKVAAAQFRWSS